MRKPRSRGAQTDGTAVGDELHSGERQSGELTCSGEAPSAGYWVESELNPLSVKQRGENDRVAAEEAETPLLWRWCACADVEDVPGGGGFTGCSQSFL